jgi:hypothetical protein
LLFTFSILDLIIQLDSTFSMTAREEKADEAREALRSK